MTRLFNIIGLSIAACGMMLAGCGTNGDAATVNQTPAAEVAQRVRDATDDATRDVAVEELARRGEAALPEIRELVSESDEPTVRAPLVEALGAAKDYESVEQLFELLNDSSVDVRREADEALQKMFGIDAHFDAEAPQAERDEATERYRQFWERTKGTNLIEWGKNPGKAKQSLEKRVRFQ